MPDKHDEAGRQALLTAEEAYARFVPRQFLHLLGRPSIVDVALGDHVEQQMTLLFSDIRDFTSLSESILPAENFRFINSYLSTMEPVVSRHQGFVDKYIGDAIMALFPTDADDAVRCGIDMLRQLVKYNDGRANAGYAPIRIGIGINTGLVMMGTVGGHNRMDSTVIGDTVNKAARLEGLTKSYNAPFLITEHTLHALRNPDDYCIRLIDRLSLKGRYPAQSIYEVFDADPEPLWLAKQGTLDVFEEALAFHHLGNSAAALPLLEKCLEIAPDDLIAEGYLERCREAIRAGSDKNQALGVEVGWRSEYSIGIDSLDRQHTRLLDLIDALARVIAAADAGSGAKPETIATEFAEHLTAHFNAEENLMRRYNYPFLAEHQQQHQVFFNAFEGLWAEIEVPSISKIRLLFRIQLQLVDWYINHITKSDVHLGNFLLRAGLR